MPIKVSTLLLVFSAGFFAYTGYLLYQQHAPIPDPAPQSQPQAASPSATLRLAFPQLDISLPVYPAKLTGTHWDYSSIGISHLSSTPWPGQPGNAVFYGHDWPNLLGRLHAVQIGDQIKVTTSAGNILTYNIDATRIVSPDHLEVIAPTPDSRLTLFTCTGFLDSQRLVVTAHLLHS